MKLFGVNILCQEQEQRRIDTNVVVVEEEEVKHDSGQAAAMVDATVGAARTTMTLLSPKEKEEARRKSKSTGDLVTFSSVDGGNKEEEEEVGGGGGGEGGVSGRDRGQVEQKNPKRPKIAKSKAAVQWTEEEHKSFLQGLEEIGKGNWKWIAKKFVCTRTPTQVASHAQKYFNRLQNPNKKRASLFDMLLIHPPHNNHKPDESSKSNADVVSSAQEDQEQAAEEEEEDHAPQMNRNYLAVQAPDIMTHKAAAPVQEVPGSDHSSPLIQAPRPIFGSSASSVQVLSIIPLIHQYPQYLQSLQQFPAAAMTYQASPVARSIVRGHPVFCWPFPILAAAPMPHAAAAAPATAAGSVAVRPTANSSSSNNLFLNIDARQQSNNAGPRLLQE